MADAVKAIATTAEWAEHPRTVALLARQTKTLDLAERMYGCHVIEKGGAKQCPRLQQHTGVKRCAPEKCVARLAEFDGELTGLSR